MEKIVKSCTIQNIKQTEINMKEQLVVSKIEKNDYEGFFKTCNQYHKMIKLDFKGQIADTDYELIRIASIYIIL